jgi:hypothetical protein
MVNDILDFTKLNAGRLELHTAPFKPVAVLQVCLGFILQKVHALYSQLIMV